VGAARRGDTTTRGRGDTGAWRKIRLAGNGARVDGVIAEDERLAAVLGHRSVLPVQFGGKVAEAEVEQARFDVTQAREAPRGHNHLLHEEILGGPGGLVFGLESFERFVEVLLIFAGEDSGFGTGACRRALKLSSVILASIPRWAFCDRVIMKKLENPGPEIDHDY